MKFKLRELRVMNISSRPLRVVVAPDSFKGTLTAAEAADAIASGLAEILPPGSEILRAPMADGGEGTVDAWLAATRGAKRIECDALDPLGRPIRAAYGWLGAKRIAVVELAAASGLPLLAPEERDPGRASTVGTGLLVRDALSRGARTIYLGLGGSATNDGGSGLAAALGARFLDEAGAPLPPGGLALARLARVDLAPLRAALRGVSVLAACDVTNPLCGPAGASAVFGPQKCARGVEPGPLVAALDAALAHFADVVAHAEGAESAEGAEAAPGAGAAGGAGFGVLALLGGRLVPGVEWIAGATGLAEKLVGADWAVTGEGALDAQTFRGKTPAGVAAAARAAGARVAACCGRIDLRPDELAALGVAAAEASSRPGLGMPESREQAFLWLATAAKRLANRMLYFAARAEKNNQMVRKARAVQGSFSGLAGEDELLQGGLVEAEGGCHQDGVGGSADIG